MSLRARLSPAAEPLYLMDGSAFVFRGFYAFRNMARSDGFPTNALYIVARLILRLLREERPAHFAFIMDGKGKNFRHERFPAYKAQRPPTPEPLALQLAPLRALLDSLGVPVIVSEGCEADDCIASLAARFRNGRSVVLVGADKDLKQCLHENVVLWDPAAKEEKVTTLADFRAETGMNPSSWPDYQALVGDASDNIPGVPQIGPKTALELIREFPTLEDLFDRLPAVPPKIRSKLEGQRENALLYRELTTLSRAVCSGISLEQLAVRPVALAPVLRFMGEYELRSLAREVESMERAGLFLPRAAGKSAASPAGVLAEPLPGEAFTAASESASRSGASFSAAAEGASRSGAAFVAAAEGASRSGGKSAPAMAQGSLFSAAPVPAEERFVRCGTIGELPPLAGGAFAVLALPGPPASAEGLLLASGRGTSFSSGEGAAPVSVTEAAVPSEDPENGWERLFTGPAAELSAFLVRVCGENPSLSLVTADLKTLCRARPELRVLPASRWFDLSLAAYLISPEERGYAWEHLAGRWGELAGEGLSPEGNPGLLALALCAFMRDQLAGADLARVFTDLELPLVPVLYGMEERGVTVDTGAFAAFLNEVQTDLERLTARIHEQAGRVFNIRSSQQLSDVLFSVLGLPKAGKTKGGAMSTSQESLEKLEGKHPIIETLLEYRKLEKLRSTYLEPLPRLADGQGRVHTTFNQTATATGRLSSSNPNLQNIPVRGPLGGRMRGCFIAAPERLLVAADYSQIELRVLAHLSGDPALLEAFRNNEDIHARTAGLLFDVPIEKVSAEQRRNAKTINFGLVYGMGAQKLAQELGIGMKEAKAFIERYFARLSRLKEFYDSVEEEARANGFVCTMAGRRRFTPDILSSNNQLRSQARRQAINTRIQGSAADIIKLAMLAVENDPVLRELEARLLLQIHDELLLEAPEANARAAGERVALLMGGVNPGAEPLSVPLLVDWGVGRSWADAH